MLLIGEKLNSSRPSVKRILEERDESALLAIAGAQTAGGASVLDINASMLMDDEGDALRWGARTVRDKLGARVMLDSPNAQLLQQVAREFGEDAILNSLMCDADALSEAFPIASETGSGIVVMLKDRAGIPDSVAGKIALAERAVKIASSTGCAPENVFIDPVLTPIATVRCGLHGVLDTVRELAKRFPACHRVCGLSNISFGMPERRLLNRCFAAMLIASGVSALICDTTDRDLMREIGASGALAGLDPGCRAFLDSYRAGRRSH
jgi:5-methyltetrahydrofolate corrinoid/iron sulfur protein methyltransferase